jgi:hypothetical protein
MNIFGLFEFHEGGDAVSVIAPDGGGLGIAATHLRAMLRSEHQGAAGLHVVADVASGNV